MCDAGELDLTTETALAYPRRRGEFQNAVARKGESTASMGAQSLALPVEEDPLAPARGVVVGTLLSAGLWAVGAAACALMLR
jgi:hypothetical protein